MANLPLQFQILGTVVLAMFLGGLIGFEREWRGKPAGLRTQMFVAGASALLVALSSVMTDYFELRQTDQLLSVDPLRIVQAIVTGVSFIGAGTIMFRRDEQQIEGITTAATIFMNAAIGITVALNQIVLAVSVTIVVLVTLYILGWVEHALLRRHRRSSS